MEDTGVGPLAPGGGDETSASGIAASWKTPGLAHSSVAFWTSRLNFGRYFGSRRISAGDRFGEDHSGRGIRRIVQAGDFAIARNSRGEGAQRLSDRVAIGVFRRGSGSTEFWRNDFREQRREDVCLSGVAARE